MKRIATIFLMILSLNTIGQITLNESNMPFGIQSYTIGNADPTGVNAPNLGPNQTWDYSSLTILNYIDRGFVNPQSSSIIGATFADTSIVTDFISNTIYFSDNYYVEDASAIKILGSVTPKQGYNINSMTGGANDSCKFPSQFKVYNNPYKVIEYPATMGSKWTNNFSDRVDFILNIPGYFVYNTPCYRVSHINIVDTVVGWGSITVPAFALVKLNTPYNALMVKRSFVAADSFYVNNSPAPAMLLSALSLTQGQQRVENSYVFWRENSPIPVLEFKFGNDNFTTPSEILFDLQISNDIAEDNSIENEIIIYPNPASDYIYIKGINKSDVEIYDLTGKKVYSYSNANNNHFINIDNFKKGNYIIRIIDNNNVVNKLISVIK